MANPIAIGTTPIVVAPVRQDRAEIRFQNAGGKDIYIKKIPLGGSIPPISATDFDVKLVPSPPDNGEPHVFVTNSIASFVAVSVTPGSALAVYQTIYI